MTSNLKKIIQSEFPFFSFNEEIETILTEIIEGSSNMFITGPAGSGKSTLLNVLQNKKVYSKTPVILSPTGISAVNVGGVTVHSFFKFPPCLINDEDIMKPLRSNYDEETGRYISPQLELIKKIDTFIIDEVSMINANMFDSIDLYLRYHLDSEVPFAGKRIILFGDLFQLPPVVKKGSSEFKILKDTYGSDTFYFFNSNVYKHMKLKRFALETVYRQKDMKFIELLHRVRKGKQTGNDIRTINQYVIDESEFMDKYDNYLYVTYTNAIADEKNKEYLDIIQSPSKIYSANYFGKVNLKDFIAPAELELKEGAQVLVCANTTDGLYNGMIGEVIRLTDSAILIENSKGTRYTVTPHTWVSYEYKLKNNKIERIEIGKFIQYPLKLAFAITAHKCQGMSLDTIFLDTGNGSFSTGQFYVALSRLRTFDGLGLKKPVSMGEVKVDETVLSYFEQLEDFNY